MSGKHWLEREPSQSPGLQRIQEAQQAAALAKTQEAQRVCEAEMAKIEAERKKLEMIARIEQKTAQVLPLLEEIRDFANRAGIHPVGNVPWKDSSKTIKIDPEFILTSKPEVKMKEGNELEISSWRDDVAREIELRYSYKGYKARFETVSDGLIDGSQWREFAGWKDAALFFGIKLRIKRDGSVGISKYETVHIPASGGRGGCSAHDEVRTVEVLLPEKVLEIKPILAEAFHEPLLLRVEPIHNIIQEVTSQPEPQASTGIGGLVKGFLGIK